MNTSVARTGKSPSTFVTVLAWIFIAIAGFSTFISILQNILIATVFPVDQMHAAMAGTQQDVPPFALFMVDHIRWFFLTFLIMSATTFIAAVGLLKRKNWARIIFIIIMAAGILWNIVGLVIQQLMFSSMPGMAADASDGFSSGFGAFATAIMIASVICALGFSILFGWIIKRLCSAEIKSEFQ